MSEMPLAFRAVRQEWSDDKSERCTRETAPHRGDVSIVTTAANPNATATVRAEKLTLEVRQRIADKIGDRFGGPSSAAGPRRGRRPGPVGSAVREMKLRRVKRAGATLPPPPGPASIHTSRSRGSAKKARRSGRRTASCVADRRPRGRCERYPRDRPAPDDERLAVKRWILMAAEEVALAISLIPDKWKEEIAAASPHGLPRS